MFAPYIPPRLLLEMNAGQETPDPLFPALQFDPPHGHLRPLDFHGEVQRVQWAMLSRAFAETGGNIAEAARRLNLSRHAFRHHWSKLSSSRKGSKAI